MHRHRPSNGYSKVLESASEVYKIVIAMFLYLAKLNEEMLAVIENYPPPANSKQIRENKVAVANWKGTPVPTFIFFCKSPAMG